MWMGLFRRFKPKAAGEADHAPAHYKKGNLLKERNQFEAALAEYDRAIALDPAYANAFCNRGVVLALLDRFEAALDSYDRAIALNPDDALAYYNRGAVLRELKRPQEALESYDKAIAGSQDYLEAHYNRGLLLAELKRWEAALASYDRVIEIDAKRAEAHFHRGNALTALMRYVAAVESFDRAIALKPDYWEAFHDRANTLFYSRQFPAAVASYDRALELNPVLGQAFTGRGLSLHNLRRFEAAIDSYDRALALNADQRYLLGMRRHAQMQICDWNDWAADLARLAEGLKANVPVSTPHTVLTLFDSAALQRMAAEIWVREECPPDESLGAIPARRRGDKIRVGYFSADFREHPVSQLTVGLFETHDRSRFEITAFSIGPKANDAVRARLQSAFERFVDVGDRTDIEVALMARDMGIDIAVDLGGFTENARTRIFSLRAAPIQINFLGYPGTMGTGYMDYLIGDETVVPQAHRHHYAEKILYLPNSYLPNDPARSIADIAYTREELGLPPAGFVYCCFNNSHKITPGVFDGWMRILARNKDSVLWLAQNYPSAAANLRREASRRGVDAARLIFADRMPSLPQHLARHRAADLFLDTLPYNAHATAIDALWAGLPVLTCVGESFAGRVAASLLRAIELPELITTTAEQYEDLAVHLGTNPARLAQIRQKLANNRLVAPLFDIALFTKSLEWAYTQVYERYHASLPAEHVKP